jgi:hypothetical protein
MVGKVNFKSYVFQLAFLCACGFLIALLLPPLLPFQVFLPDFYTQTIGFVPTTHLEWFLAFGVFHQAEVLVSIFGGFLHSLVVFLPLSFELFEAGYLFSKFGAYSDFPRALIGLGSLLLASRVGHVLSLRKKEWKKVVKEKKILIGLSIVLMMINDWLQA